MSGHVRPRLEGVRSRVVVVPAVGAATRGRDHDRARAAIGELCLVLGVLELVVVGRQGVQQQGGPPAARRFGPTRNVDRIGEQLTAQLADAFSRAAAAAGRIVGALAVGEVRRHDPVEDPALGHPGGLTGHVVVGLRRELGEVDFGEELADVAGGQRCACADSRQYAGSALIAGVGRGRHWLRRVVAEGRRRRTPAASRSLACAARLRRAGLPEPGSR